MGMDGGIRAAKYASGRDTGGCLYSRDTINTVQYQDSSQNSRSSRSIIENRQRPGRVVVTSHQDRNGQG